MDFIDQNEFFAWLLQYGSVALFFLLALGIVALPIPDETLLVISGFFIKTGHLCFVPTLLAAYSGSMCGITISYLIGRGGGHYLLQTYGKWLGLKHHHLEATHAWFEHYGKWVLFFGYFVPGIRHLTGVAAGTLALPYQEFAFFAYAGAIVWGSTFLAIGFWCGDHCLSLLKELESHLHPVGLVALILAAFLLLFYMRKRRAARS